MISKESAILQTIKFQKKKRTLHNWFHDFLLEMHIDSIIDSYARAGNFSYSSEKTNCGLRISKELAEKYTNAGYKVSCWEKNNGTLVFYGISWQDAEKEKS